VPNLFINRANIGDKKFWRAYFGFVNNNKRRIALFKDTKGHFLSEKLCAKVLRAFKNILAGKKNGQR
jgi:hypothetical protein